MICHLTFKKISYTSGSICFTKKCRKTKLRLFLFFCIRKIEPLNQILFRSDKFLWLIASLYKQNALKMIFCFLLLDDKKKNFKTSSVYLNTHYTLQSWWNGMELLYIVDGLCVTERNLFVIRIDKKCGKIKIIQQ